MSDMEYLEQTGKRFEIKNPDGKTESLYVDEVFHNLNDGLTRVFDRMFGPDEVDAFDASCNTCKHFVRKPMTAEEKRERNIFGMPGHCALKDVPATAWHRGIYCGIQNEGCYENRRTGMRPAEACIGKGR